MSLESRDCRMHGRLARLEKNPNLRKQVITDPDNGSSVHGCREYDRLSRILQDDSRRSTVGDTRDTVPIHRNTITIEGEHGVPPPRTGKPLRLVVECGGLTVIDHHELRSLVIPGAVRAYYHFVASAPATELPRCLEQLEE